MENSNDMHYLKPLQLFQTKKSVYISAPMVRYSKLAFRNLVRKYGCDLCFTPMIIAESFVKSEEARHSDFTYCLNDRPLIVQFAANNSSDFVNASELVSKYCDGVDLNCGCPQRWAIQESYGACLMNKPEIVSDIVKQLRNAISEPDFTMSIKMRIHNNLRKTIDFAQQMEAAGLSFLTVHGRTKEQRSEPVNFEAISQIKSSVRIPVVVNGDIKSLENAVVALSETNANGVMAARGLLANPSLFSGTESTSLQCITDWVNTALQTGTTFTCFHNHLIYMMDRMQSRADRRYFNALGSVSGVVTFLREKYDLAICKVFHLKKPM